MEDAEDRLAREVLGRFAGGHGIGWQGLMRPAVVVTAAFVAVVFYISSLFVQETPADKILKSFAALAAVCSFGSSYVQWYLGRQEISFEKYYDMVALSNQYIVSVGRAERPDPDGTLDHLRNMRVFTQLDTLEYVIGKFSIHFVEADVARRAIRVFIAECDQAWFREKVLYWIGSAEGRQVAKGYPKWTRDAARYIAQHRPAATLTWTVAQ